MITSIRQPLCRGAIGPRAMTFMPPILSSFHSATARLAKLDETELEEKFVRGSGPGGQKINKVRNCVQLKHVPTGLMVQCQEARALSANRSIARRLLERKVEHLLHGENSKVSRAIRKKQRSKQRARRRARHRNESLSMDNEDDDAFDRDEEEPVRIQLSAPSWAEQNKPH